VERVDRAGGQQEVSPIARRVRVAAGIVALVVLGAIGVMLIPPYFDNLRFQRYLEGAVHAPLAPDSLKAQIVNKADELGLPVRLGDIHITPHEKGVRVEIIYVIRVDLPLYTVDLHFHPAAQT
jgi:hypothetical protein